MRRTLIRHPEPAPDAVTLPDLTGRRALVTGGSDGVGAEIATRLAAAGAEVVLPVRDRAKGEGALARLRARVPTAQVHLAELDLASLDSVARLGTTLRAEGAPLHLLVANAGTMTPPERRATAEGHELQLGTNHLGHVALVAELFELLTAGSARVVSQTSIAANRGAIDWDDLDHERSYHPMRAYRASKIALGLFALELDRRSRRHGWGLSSALSHPGVVPTGLLAARPEIGRDADGVDVRLIRWLSARGLVVGTPASAALPALVAATEPEAGGRLYGPSGLGHVGGLPGGQRLPRPLHDEAEAQRVWERSLDLVGASIPDARGAERG